MRIKQYLILCSFLLIALGVMALLALRSEMQQEQRNFQMLVGSLYESDPDLADQVLTTAFTMQTDVQTLEMGRQAAEQLGYTEDAYAILTVQDYHKKILLFAGGLIFPIGFLFILFYLGILPCENNWKKISYELQSLQEQHQSLQHYMDQREKQIELYIENIAHQIKTPLSGILLNLDLLENRWEKEKSGEHRTGENTGQRNAFQIMQDSRNLGENIKTYIMKLLNLARLEAGKIHMRQDVVELADLLQEVRKRYGEEKITVRNHAAEEVLIRGDWDWLMEAICNIVENSLRHTQSELPVQISMADSEEEVQISIVDQGEGITPQEVEHVFERYHTDGEKERFSTGIGLNLARYVIREHRGDIYAESKERQGTKIKFRLPKYKLKDKVSLV